VNLEVDILAKYVERLLAARLGGDASPGGLSEAFLREHGFA
jgi:riboflavin synthase